MVDDLRSKLWLTELRRRIWRARQVREFRAVEDHETRRLAAGSLRVPEADVAVVIPTYRREDLVAHAVESVLAQSHDDLAVLVVADGPPTPTTLPDDERLSVVALERNVGVVGVVRNVGIRLTRSRSIAFLDDDNTWSTDHLATVLTALDDGADLAYTAVDRVLPDGRHFDQLFETFDRAQLRHRNYVDISSLAVRRAPDVLFSRLPRRPGQAPGEDWELLWRLSRRRRVVGVAKPTVRYLVNPDSYFWQGFTDHAERIISSRAPDPDGSGPT